MASNFQDQSFSQNLQQALLQVFQQILRDLLTSTEFLANKTLRGLSGSQAAIGHSSFFLCQGLPLHPNTTNPWNHSSSSTLLYNQHHVFEASMVPTQNGNTSKTQGAAATTSSTTWDKGSFKLGWSHNDPQITDAHWRDQFRCNELQVASIIIPAFSQLKIRNNRRVMQLKVTSRAAEATPFMLLRQASSVLCRNLIWEKLL